jgi:hypothetical protein
MKINELIENFDIFVTNEEKKLLDRIKNTCNIEIFTEREQVVIENLIRKSLLSKVYFKGNMLVSPNEKS